MILGKLVDGRVTLPISFCLGEDTALTIEFVVDTDFNSYLTLPPEAVVAMRLPVESMVTVRLADGSQSQIPIHLAKIRWDGREQFVTVLATGTKPLLGTALLQDFRLTVEFIDGGVVKLEKIIVFG